MRGGGLQKKKAKEMVDSADNQSEDTAVVAGWSVELCHLHAATREKKKKPPWVETHNRITRASVVLEEPSKHIARA